MQSVRFTAEVLRRKELTMHFKDAGRSWNISELREMKRFLMHPDINLYRLGAVTCMFHITASRAFSFLMYSWLLHVWGAAPRAADSRGSSKWTTSGRRLTPREERSSFMTSRSFLKASHRFIIFVSAGSV